MRHNIVLAGVGGQGILTIARGLSVAALNRGLNVKQAEVHGMSQRGGAVYSHVRMSDSEIFSDTIGAAQADMLLAVEPLEALRYASIIRSDGVIVANTNAVTNIPNYPPIEEVLDRIAEFPQHVLIDMERLGRAAGSPLAANIVALGAASLFLSLSVEELEEAVAEMFAAKGERVLEVNRRAFRFGRTAASAYLEGIERGARSRTVRQWVETLSAENLALDEAIDASPVLEAEELGSLTGAEAHAFESILMGAIEDDRRQLYEHEVYRLIELVGAISPPRHTFVTKGGMIQPEVLAQYPGDKVVLKLVSPDVVHKSDAQAVVFVPNEYEAVRREIDRMVERHTASRVAGVLVVEFVETGGHGLGGELFVGIRSTREFGPVIAAGLGGVATEYLARRMRPGVAVAKAVANETSAEEFLDLFRSTAAYELLSGSVRGHHRIVSDGELIRCFRAFIAIARRFCIDRGEEGPDIGELEVNPFAFHHQRLVPLDGRGRLATAPKALPERPLERVKALLQPRAIAVAGVSANSMNFGRIILNNILKGGFDRSHLYVIKEEGGEIDGVRCVAHPSDLPEPVDLLVVATPAPSVPGMIDAANASEKVGAGIVIPGGLGETEGSGDLGEAVRDAIARGRRQPDGGAVFLGPNCMGVRSRLGKYDTFFIPESKLDPYPKAKVQPIAIISQSGAFAVSRLSRLPYLNPAYAISIGNQMDVTVSDLLRAVADDAVQAVGVYLEGFANLDGAAFVHAVRESVAKGKKVIFYKAGRTESGRSAAAGHTASVAGDYDICQAAAEQAGAIIARDFEEFERLLELAALLAEKKMEGSRLFAITNAGMEAVAIADAVGAASDGLSLAQPSPALHDELQSVLASHKLDGLVSARNPLDVTPMANEAAYGALVERLQDSAEVDALIVSAVPLTPQLRTTDDEIGDPASFANLVPIWAARTTKPLIAVIDSGPGYEGLVDAIRAGGVPVFRSADAAARTVDKFYASSQGTALEAIPSEEGAHA